MHERVELYEITVGQSLITYFLYPGRGRADIDPVFFSISVNFLPGPCRHRRCNLFEGLGNVKNFTRDKRRPVHLARSYPKRSSRSGGRYIRGLFMRDFEIGEIP